MNSHCYGLHILKNLETQSKHLIFGLIVWTRNIQKKDMRRLCGETRTIPTPALCFILEPSNHNSQGSTATKLISISWSSSSSISIHGWSVRKLTKAWLLTSFCGKNYKLYLDSAMVYLPIFFFIIGWDNIYLIKSVL